MRCALALVALVAACGPALTGDPSLDSCLLNVACEGVPNDTETPEEFCERTEGLFPGCEDEFDTLGRCLIDNGTCEGGDLVVDGACDEENQALVDCA